MSNFKLTKEAHFAIIPAHVRYDTMVFDTSSCEISFYSKGVRIATLGINRFAMGDVVTINDLKGEIALNFSQD